MSAQLATLPDISSAKLPATYEAAKHALSECSRIDECQNWADKAEALASYAKQSKDESLRKMADRIQARAIRRCGELLKKISPARGHENGSVPTRSGAASSAGLSEHQRKTALRVADIPEKEFERQVESETPPTVTRLAEQGKKPLVNLGQAKPKDFARATQALAQLRRFAEFAAANDPTDVASGVTKSEIQAARAHVASIDSWLDRFITSLGD